MRVRSSTDGVTWPAAAFPGLPGVTARLRNHVLGLVCEDGAVRDPCASRVLESALALRLLEKTGLDTAFAHGLRGFLAAARPVDGFERAVTRVALQHAPALGTESGAAITARAPGFTGPRKRAFVQALTCLWGGAPGEIDFSEAFQLTGLHSWARVQVTAVKVVLAASSGQFEAICDEDVLLLLSTQRLARVWEGNVLLHVWVLHALSFLPGTGRLILEGVRKLKLHQRPDGGLPFVTDLDTWCSVTGGLALVCAGADGERVTRIAGHLVEQQRPGGGWTGTDTMDQTDVDDTSVAIEFLHVLDGRAYRETIERGIRSLMAVRGTDGGFPTYLAGAPSEAGMTAAVTNALSVVDAAAHRDEIDAGLGFLAAAQNPDGSFPPGWSASGTYDVFRALLATRGQARSHSPKIDQMAGRALAFVRTHQHPDGGWGQRAGAASDPLSTAYALIALSCQDDPAPAARGFAYLRTRQLPDGRVVSPPDAIGPRPFVYQIPALASIFSLLALAHLDARITPAARLCPQRSQEHRTVTGVDA